LPAAYAALQILRAPVEHRRAPDARCTAARTP